jgi:CPA2 family monovalent cation:H+ antiporter-2
VPHSTALIVTVAAGLALAFVFGYLATRLRVPALVGYLVAGFAVGPYSPGFVADAQLASQLAEIGVILLMFGVGLHFSVRDLLDVRRVAGPGALVGITALCVAGAGLATAWGWAVGEALMFGLCVSISSTVVVIRAFEERDTLGAADGKLAVGWMVVEDLVMVVVLVLLPALAPTLGAVGGTPATIATDPVMGSLALTLVLTVGKVVVFAALMYVVGRRAVPWLLWQVARSGSRELFTLAVLATALGIATGAAALFGVAVALGAFFAGLVISESDLSHQAAANALPLQDAFAVLFFVSVGMLVDPAIVLREPGKVLAAVALVMGLKPMAALLMLLRTRTPVHTAVTVSASLGEIGEFSFILAGLGVSLGLMDEDARGVVLAAALLSIALNPVLFRIAPFIERWVQRRWHWVDVIEAPAPLPLSSGRSMSGHAIVVGYGRVGSTIGEALTRCGLEYAVVEQDRVVVDKLRTRGVCAVFGDASRPGVLEQASPATAKLLVVTAPDPFHVRQVIEIARQVNPGIGTVVRTHSVAEQGYLEALGVGRAIMGERELALGMVHYAMVALGRGEQQVAATVEALRREPAGVHVSL